MSGGIVRLSLVFAALLMAACPFAYFYDRIFLCSYHPTLLTISSRADLTDICLGPPAWEKR